MGIADGFILDGAQAKSLVGAVGGLLEPPIVENERFGLGIFEEKLAVVSALEAARELPARIPAVKPGALEERPG
jgi:hypothetical protein